MRGDPRCASGGSQFWVRGGGVLLGMSWLSLVFNRDARRAEWETLGAVGVSWLLLAGLFALATWAINTLPRYRIRVEKVPPDGTQRDKP